MSGFKTIFQGKMGIRAEQPKGINPGRQRLYKLVAVSLLGWLSLLNATAWGQFSGGSGTQVDPYLISSANDLQTIGLNSIYWNKHFKLTVDLDLTGRVMTPIGTQLMPFSGTFDGSDYTISKLTIDLPTTIL